MPKKLIAYSLFSGAGGMHLGIENAGFEVTVASDIEEASKNTHLINWPKIPFIQKDCRQLTSKELLKASRGKKPDLIFGGPPCQGFSTIGDKLSSDPRNDLFSSLLRITEELNPSFVIIENVKSITTMYDGRFSKWIQNKLDQLGYNVYLEVLNSADFGVPQLRNRAFYIGTKIEGDYEFPKPTHGISSKKPYLTVGSAINDLINKGVEIPNHIALNHSEIVIDRYKLIPEGGKLPNPDKLPKRLRRKNFGNTYKRLDREKPSLTMVPGNNAFPLHPVLNRSLTPREAARIQSFPDKFIFSGDRRRQCILVGNAVPPLLAKVIGKSIIFHIKKNKSKRIEKTKNTFVNLGKIKKTQKNNNKYNFIDLFSGAGGFTIGLERSGLKSILSADFNNDCSNTHKNHAPHVPFMQVDLSKKQNQKKVFEFTKEKKIFCIVGGPPCQGFSIFGKRRFVNSRGYNPHKDERNKLVFSFTKIVKDIQPRWFVMENVQGLTNLDKGNFLKFLIKEFKNIGYHNVEWKVLNAANYGVPQLRKRLVIIGNKTGHIIPWPKKKFFEKPKDWQSYYRTVGEVLHDLSNEESYKNYLNHVPMKHKPLLVERYKYIKEGEKLNIEALPEKLKEGYRTKKVKNFSHIFKRLHREKPSLTMVPGHNAFPIHPFLNRALTVREAARIQTFPDDIEFTGSRQEQCIQVGNAFPPLLAELIGNNLIKAEKNNWFVGKVPKSAYYSLVEKKEEELNMELNL